MNDQDEKTIEDLTVENELMRTEWISRDMKIYIHDCCCVKTVNVFHWSIKVKILSKIKQSEAGSRKYHIVTIWIYDRITLRHVLL